MGVGGTVVQAPQVEDYVVEVLVFLLHLLVVRSALVGSATPQKIGHGLEDLVHSPHLLVLEVAVEDLQKPVVLLLFLRGPVPNPHARLQSLALPTFISGFG